MGSAKTAENQSGGFGGRGGMRGAGGGDKPKNFGASLGKLVSYCKKYLPAILIALSFTVVATIFSIVGPNQLSKVTDLISSGLAAGGIDLAAIGSICVMLVFLYAASFLLNYLQGFIMATVTQRVSKTLRSDISGKINRLPLRYFDNTTTGDVLSRVTNDVDSISQTLNQSVGSLISAAVMFVGCLIMMLYLNWIMALAALLSTILGFGLMMLIIGRSQKYFTRQQNDLGAINGHIEEIYAGQQVVKVYNGEREAKETFRSINTRMEDSGWKSQFMSGLMQPLMGFVGNLGYVVVCVVGAILAMNGVITFGVIVAFMIYVRMFTQPLSQLAQAATTLQSTAAASERVFEFLEEPEMEDESHKVVKLETAQGDVDFEHVNFGYIEGKTIIHDFSAQVKAGQKIAIVGPTGAGKTTIVNLLMRFYELNGGQIRVDGVPIDQLTRENVHSLFCMVLQDTWLFEGTIKENIVYNKKDVDDEDVVSACKLVGIDHYIRTLPKGYDTVLNENTNLSAGQKQLITIARAMIENAPLLILDEATSSVDTRTEQQIQKAMDALMYGRTSFVIAHRLSTIKNADMILVMKDGDIIESGNHEDLMAESGFYADLYNSQFEQTDEPVSKAS
ncbi:MAG: ABC transporter ATP-binding protein [Oscillospiraceae bacterium]